jgi:hypothetical protein
MEHFRIIGNDFIEKKKYDTLEEAIEAAKVINKHPQQIHKVVSYKCKLCCRYHIGKNKTILDHNKDIYKI